jgi:hypothetical protein
MHFEEGDFVLRAREEAEEAGPAGDFCPRR